MFHVEFVLPILKIVYFDNFINFRQPIESAHVFVIKKLPIPSITPKVVPFYSGPGVLAVSGVERAAPTFELLSLEH